MAQLAVSSILFKSLPTNNPISIALKMAASSLRLSNTYLGASQQVLRVSQTQPEDSPQLH